MRMLGEETAMTKKDNPLIAVVDDDSAVLESVSDLLASAGFASVSFASAQGLLDCEELPAIRCVVSDIRMPVINGWQLASILRSRYPALPIVLITAHETEESGVLAYPHLLATVHVLRKPFEASVLLRTIDNAILPLS